MLRALFDLLIRVFTAMAMAAPLAAAGADNADLTQAVNTIRKQGCEGKRGAAATLRANTQLDEVAREWSRGGRLHDALARAEYRIVNSASMRVEGAPDDRTIARVLESSYCDVIVNPAFSDIGVYRRGRDVWIVVADPFRAPSTEDAAQVSSEVLKLVNAARAHARKCGSKSFRAAPPLKYAPALERAARVHAADMAKKNFFEHRGSDGSEPAQRVSRTGYRWRAVGENIAAGAADAKTVVQGWIESPGHCANIMGAQFHEMGVAYVVNARSRNGIYWAQVFATPR